MRITTLAILLAASSAFAWTECPHATLQDNRLTVDLPPNAAPSALVSNPIDLTPYLGGSVQISIRASGRDIAKPPQSWLGCKFMLHFKDRTSGTDLYPEGNQPHHGSFDEQEFSLCVDLTNRDPINAELVLGLQQSTGHVEYDLSSLRIERVAPLFPRVNQDYRVQYPERVLNAPRARGVMLPAGNSTEDDFRTLHEWGSNLARYQMCRAWGKPNTDRDLEEYDQWITGRLDHLEQILSWAQKYGIRIVVDLHTPPGGRSASGELNCFYEEPYAEYFIALWKRIATRFKNRPEIYGYDLINEPNQRRPTDFGYWELQRRAAEAIRAIDPDTSIIVAANFGDGPDGFSILSPLAMDNVIYQVHLYAPHAFTHQGVGQDAANYTPSAWPSTQPDGTRWDREYLRAALAPVRDFEHRHNAKIYVGEFSAITWAEGAGTYLEDAIALFDEYHWDWSYHAFREWAGWSVEHQGTHPSAPILPSTDNPRRRALLEGFRHP